jgi:hypothetical protein
VILFRWPLVAATFLLLFCSSLSYPQSNCVPTTKTLPDGETVSVRATNSNNLGQACEVTVRDRNGRTVFSDTGFNAEVVSVTGRDIDNDGRPDAVVGVDTRGDNHWDYPVISFAPRPRVLMKLPPAMFDFDTTAAKTLIWTTAVFADLGQIPEDAPKVLTAHEFRTSGFVDVTSEYCKRMLAGDLRGPGDLRPLLNSLPLRSKQASRTNTGNVFERQQAREAAMSLALQQIYCGQVESASDLVLEVWPTGEQSIVRRRLKGAVNGRWPELAKRLGNW